MMCNLLSSPKASGVGPTLAKEKVLDLLFSGCKHRQGQLKSLQETDRAGHLRSAFGSKASRAPKGWGST